MSLTPVQIEGLKQFEAERQARIKRVMSKYQLVNGKFVKKKNENKPLQRIIKAETSRNKGV